MATLHCLTACGIGEIAGTGIGSALGGSNGQTVALAVALAFAPGFAMTALPFLRRGHAVGAALRIARASGISARMIRRFKAIGGLPDSVRSGAGYRRYGADILHRLQSVRRARDVGFSSDEIAQHLSLAGR